MPHPYLSQYAPNGNGSAVTLALVKQGCTAVTRVERLVEVDRWRRRALKAEATLYEIGKLLPKQPEY